jgi:glycosyltransferase involved in cell wall biosynthesis
LLRPILPPHRLVFALRSSFDYSRADWLQRAVYALETRLSPSADLIIANAEAGKQAALRRGMNPDRLAVIGNLIDARVFAPDCEARARQRSVWGIADDAPLIGMAARLDPMKGHATFLAAAALLRWRQPSARFVLIGAGPTGYADRLKQFADRLDLGSSVLWAGDIRDMPAAYNALDLATLSSDAGEGFPNAVAEAMACGVPVVATDTGDAARLIGETGLVVPPRDPARLADAWTALLAADRTRLGAAARQRIMSEFDMEQALDHKVSVLMALAKSPLP